MIEAYHLTPAQVDALDPGFVDELMTARQARADHELLSMDSKDNPELRRAQDKRRSALVKWRHGE